MRGGISFICDAIFAFWSQIVFCITPFVSIWWPKGFAFVQIFWAAPNCWWRKDGLDWQEESLTLSQDPPLYTQHTHTLVVYTSAPNLHLVEEQVRAIPMQPVRPFSFKCGTSLGRWRMAATTCEDATCQFLHFHSEVLRRIPKVEGDLDFLRFLVVIWWVLLGPLVKGGGRGLLWAVPCLWRERVCITFISSSSPAFFPILLNWKMCFSKLQNISDNNLP